MGTMPDEGDTFGRYRIDKRIGRGGMGVVFAATQVDLDRVVALKLLSADLMDTDEHRERFRREAMALAKLESSRVVQVYDAGEQDGWMYIATQLIPDGDLAQLLKTHGPMEPAQALQAIDQVLEALADAHEAGMLHRDIKPSNVLVRKQQETLRFYVCDFGISQMLDAEHTRTLGVVGTLGYMAPERHEGDDATVATEIYSVGCLLWALVSGEAPYRGTDYRVARAHHEEPIPQLEGDDAASRHVNELLMMAMAKDPSARFRSATAMRGALSALSEELPVDGTTLRDWIVSAPTDDTFVHRAGGRTPTPGRGRADTGSASTGGTGGTGGRSLATDGSAPAAPPPVAVGPAYAAAPSDERRRASPLLIGAAVAAAAMVTTLIVVLVSGGDDTDDPAAVGFSSTPSEPDAPDNQPATTSVTPTPSVPSPSATSAPPLPATCWNGKPSERVSDCSLPEGRKGLEYVFPSMSTQSCTKTPSRRLQLYKCTASLSDGTPVTLNYSHWTSVSAAYAHYSDGDVQSEADVTNPDGEVVLHRWFGYSQSGGAPAPYKAAQVFLDYPYSVSWYVPLADQRQAVIDQRVFTLVRSKDMRGTGPA